MGRRRNAGASGVTFTDDLTDGAGTPVAITTSIAARQAWQRGRSTLTLAGTYDLSGDPSGMAWRVGSGDWVALTSETIGSGNWSGTLSIPATYLAQGTLEVKPINGLSVTPATVANITVTDVFAILGDSMTGGVSDAADAYSGAFTWVERGASAWSAITSQTSIWPQLANRLDAAGIPPAFVRYGASGSAFRPYLGGSAGGSWRPSPDNGDTDFYYSTALGRLNAADSGGFALLIWEQGPNDVIDGNTFYAQDVADLLDAFQAGAENFSGVKLALSITGEVLAETTKLDTHRTAQLSLIASDPDVLRGPSWIDLDFGDDVHFGKDGPGVEQQAIGGDRWWQSVERLLYGGSAPATGPAVTSVAVTGARTIEATFDRAVVNHTDATGWTVEDNSGTVSVASAAQGASASIVILTLASDLRTNSGEIEAVSVSFGKGNSGVGSTLRDTTAIPLPVEFTLNSDAGEALPFLESAPTTDVTPAIGVTATTTTGTWQSTTALTYSYRWLQEAGGAAISGETGSTFTGQSPRDDSYIGTVVCEVTATNSAGASSTETSAGYTPAEAFTGGRQGGWWPIEDIGALWQDTAASTAVAADADPVARISDGSGNSNHMLQADTALRLTYDTNDTYANVTGDGAADGLLTGTFSADGDILMVCAADFDAATGTVLSYAMSGALTNYIYIEHDTVRHLSNDFNGNAAISIAPTGRSVVTVVATKADMSFRVYVNGTLAGTGTKAGTSWFDKSGDLNKVVGLARRTSTSFQDYNSGAIYGAAIVVGSGVAALRADIETYYGGLIGLSL